MKKAITQLAVAAALAGTVGAASAATAFLFNPTGGGAGGAVTATTIDQAPGNALSIGGITATQACLIAGGWTPGQTGSFSCAGAPGGGFTTQLTYQANLAQLTNLGVPVFNQNDGGLNFTFSASVTERIYNVSVATVDAITGLPTIATVLLDLAPVQTTNFFRWYATGATAGNDLTGAGFGTGTIILAGQALISSSSSTSQAGCAFTVAGCNNLDNFSGDSWNSFNTVINNGSTQLSIEITSALAGYFPDLPVGSVIMWEINTSQVVPFNQANPSCAMIDQTTGAEQGYSLGVFAAGSCTADAVKLGTINGFNGTDFLFQADANSSLEFQRVPEPGSLALVAGSLMAAGLWGRRRSRGK